MHQRCFVVFEVLVFCVGVFLANGSSAQEIQPPPYVGGYRVAAKAMDAVASGVATLPMAAGQDGWTHGVKRLLFMRLVFPDDPVAPISEEDAAALMAEVDGWYVEKSYGATGIAADVTPLLMMPQPKSWYGQRPLRQLMGDARAAAAQNGFETNSYDLDIARFNSVPGWNFAGTSIVRGKGLWLQSSSVGVVIHELGHNYGLQHANRWAAFADSIIGPGTNAEYGNDFDMMGQPPADPGLYHFNVAWLDHLTWLGEGFIRTVTNSGVYRLSGFDVPNLAAGEIYALKIRKDGARNYWAEFRRSLTSNAWAQNGLILNWSPWESSRFGTQLLDTTPGSPAGNESADDAPLVVGRTLSDHESGVHITPLAVSSVSGWIEVCVNLGFFSNNVSPNLSLSADRTAVLPGEEVRFTASADDADGDALAFHWDFGDLAPGSNSMEIVRAWANAGEYVVRCTASDMKGGLASRHIVVAVGSPTTFRVSGRITNELGAPLPNVRVHNGEAGPAYRGGFTDSDGDYTLAGLAMGNHSLAAVKYGYAISSAGWVNPVTVGATATGLDWRATAYPPVNVVANDSSAAESASAGDRGAFTIWRDGSLEGPLTIRFTLEGSAELWDDFTLSAGVSRWPYSVVLPAGVASTNIVVAAIDDSGYEGPETVVLTLVEDVGYRLGGSAVATITIADSTLVAAPELTLTPLSGGSYRIEFEGMPELTYRIEHTERPGESSWETLTSHTADELGFLEVIDTPPAGSRQRFYRAVFP